jgi:hypothetical protein
MGAAKPERILRGIEELTNDHSASLVDAARELLLEYGRFVIAQPGVARFCFGSLEKEVARLPQGYIEQGGGCLVAEGTDDLLGIVAYAPYRRPLRPMRGIEGRTPARTGSDFRALTQAVDARLRKAQRFFRHCPRCYHSCSSVLSRSGLRALCAL